MFYGNSGIAAFQGDITSAGVWDNGYEGVWHLNEDVVDANSVSFAGATIDVGNEAIAGNTQQDAAANSVLAVVFRVQMQ